jgi:hypothetical protein
LSAIIENTLLNKLMLTVCKTVWGTLFYVRFLTPWPEILINFQQGKSQGVRNLAQQLDLDGLPVSLASSETPPPPTPQAFLEA